MLSLPAALPILLPDAPERAAWFRALAAGGTRIVRAFANADAWLDAEVEAGEAILLFRWRQPGATSGAALLERIAAQPGAIAFVVAERLSIAESRAGIGIASGRERVCQYV